MLVSECRGEKGATYRRGWSGGLGGDDMWCGCDLCWVEVSLCGLWSDGESFWSWKRWDFVYR